MRILRLHLKRKWWEQIRDGNKPDEFRLVTPYWEKRLVNREYDQIHLLLGYPKKGDDSKVLKCIWSGVSKTAICHEEFGREVVDVFVIPVTQIEKGTTLSHD